MKRRNRKMHLALWLVIAPAIATVLYFAITLRPADPVDSALPDILLEELD